MMQLQSIADVLSDAEDRMSKSVQLFQREIETVRTGRATPKLLDGLAVEYHGTRMPLNQLASITAPDARLLLIQPWDRGALAGIEKEVLRSDLGLTPSNDGNVIRLPIPVLTEERRRELVKRVHKLREDKHVAVRNIRRDGLEQLRRLEKGKGISQDDLKRAQDKLQKLTDEQVLQADQLSTKKESELMEG